MKNLIFFLLALAVLLACVSPGRAGERSGHLVFEAMKTLRQNQEDYNTRAEEYRREYQEAVAENETYKELLGNSDADILDKYEAHAKLSGALAKAYNAMSREVRLAHDVSKKHLHVLYKLQDAVAGPAGEDADGKIGQAVEQLKPFLANGQSLLASMSQYRHLIEDPAIHSKLNSAFDTAKMLSDYRKYMVRNHAGGAMNKQRLKLEIARMVDQLNALYVQTDVLDNMIQDKKTILKMANEVAAAQISLMALSDGNKPVVNFSVDFQQDMTERIMRNDEVLETVMEPGGDEVPDVEFDSRWATGVGF